MSRWSAHSGATRSRSGCSERAASSIRASSVILSVAIVSSCPSSPARQTSLGDHAVALAVKGLVLHHVRGHYSLLCLSEVVDSVGRGLRMGYKFAGR
jgi:hypothetical protein